MKVYDDLTNQREDKDEKLEGIKNRTKELMERSKASEDDIIKITDDITRQSQMIIDIKKLKNEKEEQKNKLDAETIDL